MESNGEIDKLIDINIKDIKNLDNSTKKRKNNQIEEVANTSTEENSSNKVINKSDIDKSFHLR